MEALCPEASGERAKVRRYNRPVDQQALSDVAHRHGLALVIRFGSTVTGQVHEQSDVDLGVLFERMPTSLDEELSLAADLQALEPGSPIDLTFLNRADPLLLEQVTRHARLEYGTAARFDAFKRYAFKRYQDHRRFLDIERRHLDRIVESRNA